MRVFVFENGKNVDTGTVIAIEDGFVSMVEGEEGFGYEMDSVEFAEVVYRTESEENEEYCEENELL